MGRILAIDVGEKRVGLAMTDELCIIASPFGFVEREKSVEYIHNLIHKENIDHLVVGLPYLPSGGLGGQAVDVKAFVEDLTKIVNLPIEFENEMLTSVEAEKRLRIVKPKHVKGDVDAMAATIILESFLQGK